MRDYADIISSDISTYMANTGRSQQSAAGILGPSDIGFCRQKAVLMTRGVAATDETPKWAAAVGTAIHNYVEAVVKQAHPDWLVGSLDNIKVTAHLPSGADISGHPDIVIPGDNTVLDIKTVDGFEWIKREGTSLSHKYQRHLYALGCAQAGMFNDDAPIYVGNLYFDRSGKISEPICIIEEMDPYLTTEIDSWIQDVIYAVKNQEDASRDVPAAVCERICSHFTACRGALEVHDGSELITDSTLLAAINMYVEGRELASKGESMKKAAQAELLGVNGSNGDYQVRWVEVQPTTVSSFEKVGYTRMDVRKVRR
jgi:hypothetical protein